MKKIMFIILIFFCMFLKNVKAEYQPINTVNNRFGIHILEESDISEAATLVNSNGGSWGYVTFIIRDDQRDLTKWNNFLDKLRENNLIPILRLATHMNENGWVKPDLNSINPWVDFLNNLRWPIKNRYVILFNEPNHAKEWGGEINPTEYATISNEFINKLKNASSDFFILNAGFDMASSNIAGDTADALWYINSMEEAVPGIFNRFDGWVSHSYPNPGFSASPYKLGRTSITGYRFEQNYLEQNFGVKQKAVFVTETGWEISSYLSEQIVANYYRTAFQEIWLDDNLIAVTPFLLNYPESLFESFSWKDMEGNLRQQYKTVSNISKLEGKPFLAPITNFGKLGEKYLTDKEKYLTNNKVISQLPDILL